MSCSSESEVEGEMMVSVFVGEDLRVIFGVEFVR